MKFKFKCYDKYGKDTTIKSFEETTLDEVLAQFELFLAGAGFIRDGHLEFVADDFSTESEWPDYADDEDNSVDEEPVQNSDAWKWTVSELQKTGTVAPANTSISDAN